MQRLESVLREEQARIDEVIRKEIAALPELVRPVAAHTLNAGGKRLRPLLAVMMGRLFGRADALLYTMAAAIEFFHVATLIHDDFLDNAPTRRGVASTHEIYHPVHAVLGGDAMLAHAARMVSVIGDTRISRLFADAVVHTATGEIEEFVHLGDINLSHEDYLSVITGKTAWTLRVACEIPAIHAGRSEEEIAAAATFGLHLGIAFQMVDDALDIAPSGDTGKPSGGDLRERKCTPLVKLYWESLHGEAKAAFAQAFETGSFSDAELEAVIASMRAQGLDAAVRNMAGDHLAEAEAALALLPDGPCKEALAQVPAYIRNRGN